MKRKNNGQVVAIVGPTGSGKTGWAKILAPKFNAKIISADSRQIYIGMDIGTAKDKSFHQDLIGIISPDQTFSVSEFQTKANDLINKYLADGYLPVLVGGTGLYIEAVLYGYVLPELQKESLALREKLEKLSDDELLAKLKVADEVSFQKIDHKNRRRIIRALEYSLLSKEPFSQKAQTKKPIFDSLIIGINIDRETLYAKLDARVDQMIKDGLVEEVRELLKKYPSRPPALNSIGCKEIVDYLDGKTDLKTAIEQIKFNNHSYVRRQMTWFRRDKNIKWVETIDEAENLIKNFIK